MQMNRSEADLTAHLAAAGLNVRPLTAPNQQDATQPGLGRLLGAEKAARYAAAASRSEEQNFSVLPSLKEDDAAKTPSELPTGPGSSTVGVSQVATADPVIRRWKRGKLLGRGGYGSVHQALDLESGMMFAVKTIEYTVRRDSDENDCKEAKALEREIEMLQRLRSPQVVRYLGVERTEPPADVECQLGQVHIFLEYVPGGSLASVLSSFGGSFEEALVRKYTREILLGLEYLHSQSIVHCDIKGANVLVDPSGRVALADFGAARQIANLITGSGGGSGALSLHGTCFWMAPEMVTQSQHGTAADVWSLGCTVIEMFTGLPPWSHIRNAFAVMYHIGSSDEVPETPEGISEAGKDFLRRCLVRNPRYRSSASQLLRHAFITGDLSAQAEAPVAQAAAPREPALAREANEEGGHAERPPAPGAAPADLAGAALPAPNRLKALGREEMRKTGGGSLLEEAEGLRQQGLAILQMLAPGVAGDGSGSRSGSSRRAGTPRSPMAARLPALELAGETSDDSVARERRINLEPAEAPAPRAAPLSVEEQVQKEGLNVSQMLASGDAEVRKLGRRLRAQKRIEFKRRLDAEREGVCAGITPITVSAAEEPAEAAPSPAPPLRIDELPRVLAGRNWKDVWASIQQEEGAAAAPPKLTSSPKLSALGVEKKGSPPAVSPLAPAAGAEEEGEARREGGLLGSSFGLKSDEDTIEESPWLEAPGTPMATEGGRGYPAGEVRESLAELILEGDLDVEAEGARELHLAAEGKAAGDPWASTDGGGDSALEAGPPVGGSTQGLRELDGMLETRRGGESLGNGDGVEVASSRGENGPRPVDEDRTIRWGSVTCLAGEVWRWEARGVPTGLKGGVTCMGLMRGGEISGPGVTCGGADGRLVECDLEAGEVRWENGSGAHAGEVTCVAQGGGGLGSSGETVGLGMWEEWAVVSGGKDGRVALWDLRSSSPISSLVPHRGSITSLRLLPSQVVSAAEDGGVVSCELRTMRLKRVRGAGAGASAHTGAVNCLTRMGESRVVSGGADHSIRFWEVGAAGPRCRLTLRGHLGRVTALTCFGQHLLVSASMDCSIKLWDLQGAAASDAEGTRGRTLLGHKGAITSLCALSNQRLVSGSRDGSCRLWDIGNGRCIGTHRRHSRPVTMLDTRDDVVVSLSLDSTMRVWELDKGKDKLQEVGLLPAYDAPVTCFQMINGAQLLSANKAGQLNIWTPQCESS
ncbi:hypothetical protein CYMTET_12236 [Cymbomonas tetramitiformis]|uniref:mitogen-activated protein kinase kinase kinase n=1 Tax=Cymbomonas tetramitiformis TaxID=36881 RepID=A0AAE0LC14_9CHLO|nr:hypothetical protein CYMTET_12236 [Cymbomonas tetramitiformis]